MQPSKEHDKYMVTSDQGFTSSSAKHERMSHNPGGLPPASIFLPQQQGQMWVQNTQTIRC